MNIGPVELTIVLVIVLLIFGVGRIGRLGSELGQGIRAFREGLTEEHPGEAEPPAASPPPDSSPPRPPTPAP